MFEVSHLVFDCSDGMFVKLGSLMIPVLKELTIESGFGLPFLIKPLASTPKLFLVLRPLKLFLFEFSFSFGFSVMWI